MQAADLAIQKELELNAKGYPQGMIRAAMSRARGAAQTRAKMLSEPIQEQGFYDLLRWELNKAEDWCVRVQKFLDGQSDES